jgi:hypothetical protein
MSLISEDRVFGIEKFTSDPKTPAQQVNQESLKTQCGIPTQPKPRDMHFPDTAVCASVNQIER